MIIRPAQIGDGPAIAKVHVASYGNTYKGIIPDGALYAVSVEKRTDFWSQLIEELEQPDRKVAIFVAVIDGSIRGFVSASSPLHEEDDPQSGEITALYIDPDFQGQGMGQQLLKQALTFLRQNKFHSAFVKVLDANPYKNFYAKNGGVYQARLTQQVVRGDRTLDLITYQWLPI